MKSIFEQEADFLKDCTREFLEILKNKGVQKEKALSQAIKGFKGKHVSKEEITAICNEVF